MPYTYLIGEDPTRPFFVQIFDENENLVDFDNDYATEAEAEQSALAHHANPIKHIDK